MSDIKIIPAPGILVVEPYQAGQPTASSTSKGQVHISDNMKEQDLAGIVLDIGETVVTDFGAKIECPIGIKIGSLIIHNTYYTAPYEHYNNGRRYRFVKFQEVRAVIVDRGI